MADTIKEFLVSLGYEVDGVGAAKFESAIFRATFLANTLANALQTVASKTTEAFKNFVSSFDQLNFLSQRSGQSIETIRAFGFAANQLGSSFAQAYSAVSNLANLREKFGPEGFAGLLHNLKIDPNTKDLFGDLSKRLSEMNPMMAHWWAIYLGIDEQTLFAMRKRNDYMRESNEEFDRFRKAHSDLNKEAQGVTKLKQAWGGLAETFELIIGKTFSKITGDGGIITDLKSFDKWLQDHSEEISNKLADILNNILKLATELAKSTIEVTDLTINFEKMARAIDTVSLAIEKLNSYVKVYIDLLKNLPPFKGLTPEPAPSFKGQGPEAPYLHLPDQPDKPYLGEPFGPPASLGPEEQKKSIGTRIKEWLQKKVPSWLKKQSGSEAEISAYKAARAEGLSDESARVLVANLLGESLSNPSNIHWDRSHYSQGIAQWDDVRAAKIKRKFGKEPRFMSIPEQIKALVWEYSTNPRFAPTKRALESSSLSPEEKMKILVRNFEAPQYPESESRKRLGLIRDFNKLNSVTDLKSPSKVSSFEMPSFLNAAVAKTTPLGHRNPNIRYGDRHISAPQTNNIEIHGVNDPEAAVRELGWQQKRLNADLLRNLQGAAQ